MSSIRGFMKVELKRKEVKMNRYRKAEDTLEDRIKRKLIENVQWYKESGRE